VKGGWRGVLDDPAAGAAAASVLFCSGKIFYELAQRRSELNDTQTAILRFEQFYPFPRSHLKFALKRFKAVKQWAWVQDEAENMGAWQFIRPRIEAVIGKPLTFIGRPASSSPAAGFPHIHRRRQEEIIARAVGPKP
jgi:2-oxoglutarate dehydrogenase E1 component